MEREKTQKTALQLRRHDAAAGRAAGRAACAASSLFFRSATTTTRVDWARRITNSGRHSVSPFLFSHSPSPTPYLFPFTLWFPFAIQSAPAISRKRVRSLAHLPPSATASLFLSLTLSPSVSSTLFTALNFPLFLARCALFLFCAWILQHPAVMRVPCRTGSAGYMRW